MAKKKETRIIDIRYIDVLEMLPNPYQPESRIQVDLEVAKKFALSFQEHGLIQIPVARVKDGRYEVADGWLRRAGFLCNLQEFGLKEYSQMPCEVRELTDQQMADMVMEANIVRKDLNPIELAKFYQRYLDDFKIPQVELARRHNCSQGEIANTIRLLELPGAVQEKIISQEISETHGRQLLRLNFNAELQTKMVKAAIDERMSVDQLSNRIASQIHFNSENLDLHDFPEPPFDTTECENCPNRQKIGTPFSSRKKTWRCLDKACYKRKADKAEAERVRKVAADIAAAKNEGGKGKKAKAPVLDCTKLNWRDYQDLDRSWVHIDNPEQCKTCPNRAIGKFHSGMTSPVCTNVKCFKEKERAYEAQAAAKKREEERQLTEQVKTVCDKVDNESLVLGVVIDYLLAHSRKDTREKFAKMYGITDLAEYFSSNGASVLPKIAALVLQKERYEGEEGRFRKMMADLNGTGDEIARQIAAFQNKHCKGCRYDKGDCRYLMHVYFKKECLYYWKEKEEEDEKDTTETVQVKEETGKSEHKQIQDSLPCKDCQNAPTCDRSHFYTDGQGGYVCDHKVISQEMPASCQDCLILEECSGSPVWQTYKGNPACPNRKLKESRAQEEVPDAV